MRRLVATAATTMVTAAVAETTTMAWTAVAASSAGSHELAELLRVAQHTRREQWAEVRTRGSGVAVINVIHSHINAQLGAANSSSKSSVLRLVSMPAAVSSSSLHRFLNLASPSMRPPAVARRSGPPLPNTS